MRRRAIALLLAAAPLLHACAAAPPPRPPAPPPPPPAPAGAPATPVPKMAVVLLPEADGKVGRVEVTNEGGSRTLEQGGTATRVLDGRTAPSAPAPMSAAEIAALFGDALAAQPAPPLHFILYFEQGSTELTAESRLGVPAVVGAVRERASVDISVVGHSDTAGDAARNLELSLHRAQAVAALLRAEGVAAESLEITSHGEANLLVPTGDNVSEPRNRRVEVTVR